MDAPTVHSKEILLDDFVRVTRVTVRANGELVTRCVVHRPNAIGALIWHREDQKFLLVRQLRPPMMKFDDPYPYEVVAGSFEPGESPEEAAVREVEEETGYRVQKLHAMGSLYSSPGSFEERLWLYYTEVSESDRVNAGGGIEDETVYVVALTPEELEAGVEEDRIPDAKTGLLLYRTMRAKLGPYAE